MRQIVTILIAFLVAIPLGAGFRRLKWPAFLESAGAIVSGWILGSIVSATVWLLWPPEGIDVRAVSVGAMEAAVSLAIASYAAPAPKASAPQMAARAHRTSARSTRARGDIFPNAARA